MSVQLLITKNVVKTMREMIFLNLFIGLILKVGVRFFKKFSLHSKKNLAQSLKISEKLIEISLIDTCFS